MTTRQPRVYTQLGRTAAQTFAANERMNQLLIEHLDPAAWTAKAPGGTRTIAAIFTHMHNVRTKWIRLTAPHLRVPPQLNRTHCTPQQARAGLEKSAARCAEMLAEALGGGNRIRKFHRDGWARPWPVGVEMLCYMLSHEAHHRGPDMHACASTWISVAHEGHVGAVELGRAVEGVRRTRRPGVRFSITSKITHVIEAQL